VDDIDTDLNQTGMTYSELVMRHTSQWHAVVSTVIQIGGLQLKTGKVWNCRGAVIYCEEESVSHGCLSTSTAKESSVKARQTTGYGNE
jgi:hypothetical protein